MSIPQPHNPQRSSRNNYNIEALFVSEELVCWSTFVAYSAVVWVSLAEEKCLILAMSPYWCWYSHHLTIWNMTHPRLSFNKSFRTAVLLPMCRVGLARPNTMRTRDYCANGSSCSMILLRSSRDSNNMQAEPVVPRLVGALAQCILAGGVIRYLFPTARTPGR